VETMLLFGCWVTSVGVALVFVRFMYGGRDG